MTIDAVSEMTNNALYVIIKVSLPVLLVSLVVGLVISIFQTVTSIQEQTLTFVPKIVAIFLCLVVIGHRMMNTMGGDTPPAMVEYTVQLWSSFSQYVHR